MLLFEGFSVSTQTLEISSDPIDPSVWDCEAPLYPNLYWIPWHPRIARHLWCSLPWVQQSHAAPATVRSLAQASVQATPESPRPRRRPPESARIHPGQCPWPTNTGNSPRRQLIHHYCHQQWYEYPKVKPWWERWSWSFVSLATAGNCRQLPATQVYLLSTCWWRKLLKICGVFLVIWCNLAVHDNSMFHTWRPTFNSIPSTRLWAFASLRSSFSKKEGFWQKTSKIPSLRRIRARLSCQRWSLLWTPAGRPKAHSLLRYALRVGDCLQWTAPLPLHECPQRCSNSNISSQSSVSSNVNFGSFWMKKIGPYVVWRHWVIDRSPWSELANHAEILDQSEGANFPIVAPFLLRVRNRWWV